MSTDDRKNQVPSWTEGKLEAADLPAGVDRRAFIIRSAVVGAVSVIAGCAPPEQKPAAEAAAAAPAAAPAPAAPDLSPDLDVVKKAKGPVMTTIDEFYKVGPGP